MRLLALFLSACTLLALSGCAEVPIDDSIPTAASTDGNATTAPESVDTPERPAPAAEPLYPHVTSVVTAPYTAPEEIALASLEGEHATLRLVAGPEGLRCESEPARDHAAPPGYKVARTWSRCSLSADGEPFAAGRATDAQAMLPLMDEVPVDAFTWNMSVGRVLVNNTGEHDDVLESVDQELLAAPDVTVAHRADQDNWLYYGHPYQVCDTLTSDSMATLYFTAEAVRGQALLRVDVSDHDVWYVDGTGPEIDAANATAYTGPAWWVDGDVLHARGAWGEVSQAQLNVTIDFQGEQDMVALIPPPECPDALFLDVQAIPVEAEALGVAAQWGILEDHALPVEVWHTY